MLSLRASLHEFTLGKLQVPLSPALASVPAPAWLVVGTQITLSLLQDLLRTSRQGFTLVFMLNLLFLDTTGIENHGRLGSQEGKNFLHWPSHPL